MPTTYQPIVLYGSGLFGRDNPKLNQTQLLAVTQSGFTDLILWTLHVDSDGTLVYNNTVIVRDGVFAFTFSYLRELVRAVKQNSTVQRVLFSIGSWGVPDFTNIGTLLSTPSGKLALGRNFAALATALEIDGYDFDNEDQFETTQPVVDLTTMLAGGDNSMIVTYCPFGDKQFWTKCLQDVWAVNQQNGVAQSVRWWNLQCYAGGGGNLPQQWVQAVQAADAGVTSAAFIVPGLDTSNGTSGVQTTFSGWATSDPGITGGFIWNSGAIFASGSSPAAYASAITAGLG